MPKHLIRRHLPSPERIAGLPGLGFMRRRLEEPNLWHLNRRSASGAVFWGLWFAFLPMPLHTIPAVALALMLRINLPLTVLMVWTVNPLTMLPCFYGAYQVGALLLHQPGLDLHEVSLLVDGIEALGHGAGPHPGHPISHYVEPFLLGMLVTGFVLGSLGYLLVNWYWRRHVRRAWNKRRSRAN